MLNVCVVLILHGAHSRRPQETCRAGNSPCSLINNECGFPSTSPSVLPSVAFLLLLLLLSCFITTQLCPNFPSLPLIASLSLFLLSTHHSRQHFLLYYLNVFPPRVSSELNLWTSLFILSSLQRGCLEALISTFDSCCWLHVLCFTGCSVSDWTCRWIVS